MRERVVIAGLNAAGSPFIVRAGVLVAVGLSLLMLAGCGQASPPVSTPSSPQDPVVTIVPLAASVTAGAPLQFDVRAEPAPQADLTVSVTLAGCDLAQSRKSVTITAGESAAVLEVSTTVEAAGEAGCEVTATIAPGEGYAVGSHDTAGSATVAIIPGESIAVSTPGNPASGTPLDPRIFNAHNPLVSIVAAPLQVNEGDPITFTLTARPPPASEFTVNLQWWFHAGRTDQRFAETPPQTVTMPTTGTASFALATVNDLIDNYADIVGVQVDHGTGYYPGPPPTATFYVVDDEFTPYVKVVADSSSVEEGTNVSFTLTADPAPAADVTVGLSWNVTPGYPGWAPQHPHHPHLPDIPPSAVTIPAGSTTAKVTLATTDDTRDNLADTTVEVTLTGAGHGVYFRYYDESNTAVDTASVTIEDNDD